MTLRPFKITATNTKKKGEVYIIKTHRDEVVAKEIKLGKKAFEKLLSYPITAFGYDLTTYLQLKSDNINPKFDKKDVIKALDFWIEYFVYQNKCDYILENTVNKDFELTVRELIETREAVLKLPADTQFVRQKIRPKIFSFEREYGLTFTDGKKYEPDPNKIIEFTENVLDTSNSPFSTVDQFCYKVRTMTRKEYEKYNRHVHTTSSRLIADMIRVQSNLNFEVPFVMPAEDIQRAATFENPDTGVMINSSSSALAGKRISRVDVRFRKEEEEEEPTESID